MANLVPSYTVTQNISNPTILHFVDTSTGYNPFVDERRIYLRKYDGTYLVPSGTTTNYIVWDYNLPTLDVDVMDKDYALEIDVQWIATQPIPDLFNIYAVGLQSVGSTSFQVDCSSSYDVDWGDGTIISYPSGTSNLTHTYTSPYTGNITFAFSGGSYADVNSIAITDIGQITPSGTTLRLYTNELTKLTGITSLNLDSVCSLLGIASELPSTLTNLIIQNTNLSGTLLQLPTSLQQVVLRGTTTISGTIAQLPSTLTYCIIAGYSVITGSIADLPAGITNIYLQGVGNVTGDISDLQLTIVECVITCPNTITGDISDLPLAIITFVVKGSNSISGNLMDLPNTLEGFVLEGDNTLAGNLSDLSTLTSLKTFNVVGINTLTGDFSNMPLTVTGVVLTGNNTVSDYTYPHTWASSMNTVVLNPLSGGMSSTEVDNLLIDLASVTTWVGDKIVTIKGANSARTTSSDAAVATLQSKGVTVQTN